MYKVNAHVFMMIGFLALLFYGIVLLLPARTPRKSKRIWRTSKIAEVVIAISVGLAGLLMMALAFIVGNPTAKVLYSYYFKGALLLGLVIVIIEGIQKIINWGKGSMQPKKSIFVGDIEVFYGVSTPQIFNGSVYKVVYDTLVQEPEIPFITCELHMRADDKYIGDIIFDQSDKMISQEQLMLLPIIEIHLDR